MFRNGKAGQNEEQESKHLNLLEIELLCSSCRTAVDNLRNLVGNFVESSVYGETFKHSRNEISSAYCDDIGEGISMSFSGSDFVVVENDSDNMKPKICEIEGHQKDEDQVWTGEEVSTRCETLGRSGNEEEEEREASQGNGDHTKVEASKEVENKIENEICISDGNEDNTARKSAFMCDIGMGSELDALPEQTGMRNFDSRLEELMNDGEHFQFYESENPKNMEIKKQIDVRNTLNFENISELVHEKPDREDCEKTKYHEDKEIHETGSQIDISCDKPRVDICRLRPHISRDAPTIYISFDQTEIVILS